MKNSSPIGVFDSGLGGLTVVKQLTALLPHEDIVYLGDTARVPYGPRSKETIIKFSFEDANFLLSHKVKCIVIACNTSSALAGAELKRKIGIPVFDVITPALTFAKQTSKTGRIGVIGTVGTIKSNAYKVPFAVACPLFVPFIEEGQINSPALKLVARGYLSQFKKHKIDTLILGCTHYPIIKDIIGKTVGTKVSLVDSGKVAADELKDYLTTGGMLNDQKRLGNKSFFLTDYTEGFTKVAEMFLREKITGKLKKASL